MGHGPPAEPVNRGTGRIGRIRASDPLGETVFQQLGEDTRSRLIQGAFDAITAHGIPDTRVQHILDAAQFSRRTFYQHFRGKDDVLAAVYEMATTGLVNGVQAAVAAEPDPIQKVRAAIDYYVEYQRLGGTALIALQAEAIRPDSQYAIHRDKTLDLLVEIVGQGLKDTVGTVCDPLVYRSVLMGIEGMVIHLQQKGPFTKADSARVRETGSAILIQVLAGMPQAP